MTHGTVPAAGGQPSPARALITASSVACLSATLSWWPWWGDQFPLGVIYVLVVSSFAASGVLLLSDRRTGRTGWAMIIAAFCYEASWWWIWPDSWHVGPAPFASFLIGYWWFAIGGLALLRYPEPVLARRHERAYFAGLASWIVLMKVFLAAVSEPEWSGWSADAWWITVAPDRRLFQISGSVFLIGTTAIALLLPVLLVLKVRRTRKLARADTLPVTSAAIAIGIVGSAYLIALIGGFDDRVTDAFRTITAIAALVAPVAFLVSLIQRRSTSAASAAVADLIGSLAHSATIRDIQAVLRQALDDPALVLAVGTDGPPGYLTADGYPLATAGSTRWRVEVAGRSGRTIALLLVDPGLRRRETHVRAAAAAAGITLEDGVLQRDLTAQLSESQQSRQRLTETSLSERRRIANELHDGVQAALHGVRTHLTRAELIQQRRMPPDPGQRLAHVSAAVSDAQSALKNAIDDVRGIARGIHPDVLVDHGLRPALLRVIPTDIPISLRVNGARAPRAVESMLYFFVCEAVTNVVKHAHAASAEVTITVTDTDATARIRDDGRGGARAAPGSGLAALRDRIRSLRGDLVITSLPGVGTTIEAVIPCGWHWPKTR